MAKVTISDGRPRTVSFADSLGGQVLLRKERSSSSANPEDRHYFVSGVQIAELTNNGNNDAERIDWNQSVLTHTWTPGSTANPFRWNTTGGVTGAQMGADGYDPLSPTGQGMSGTDARYTVRGGDSLQGIAQSVWGDASLWYVIASANGLSAGSALVAGQSLIVPDKVISNTNNAGTYRPYDAAHATGDLSPTTALPPKKANKCGTFGLILLAVMAIAVAAIAAPALIGSAALTTSAVSVGGVSLGGGFVIAGTATGLTAALGAVGGAIVGGAIAGAVASGVSQVFGLATGIQQGGFNWKSVALAAVSAGVTQGLSPGGIFKGGLFGTGQAGVKGALMTVRDVTLRAGLNAAAGNLVTQGIAVGTGLQKQFDWTGVAAAGIGAAVGSQIGAAAHASDITQQTRTIANYAANLAASGASAVANATARSLIDGTDFGDNIMAALPDVIAQTIGSVLTHGISNPPRKAGLADIDPKTIEHLKGVIESQSGQSTNSASAQGQLYAALPHGGGSGGSVISSQGNGRYAFLKSNTLKPIGVQGFRMVYAGRANPIGDDHLNYWTASDIYNAIRSYSPTIAAGEDWIANKYQEFHDAIAGYGEEIVVEGRHLAQSAGHWIDQGVRLVSTPEGHARATTFVVVTTATMNPFTGYQVASTMPAPVAQSIGEIQDNVGRGVVDGTVGTVKAVIPLLQAAQGATPAGMLNYVATKTLGYEVLPGQGNFQSTLNLTMAVGTAGYHGGQAAGDYIISRGQNPGLILDDTGHLVARAENSIVEFSNLPGQQKANKIAYAFGTVLPLAASAAFGGPEARVAGGLLEALGIDTAAVAAERGAFSGAYATNGELVQSIATRADNWGIRNGMGNGPIVGTAKHGYAESVLNRYQRMFGDRGLTAEARYVGGEPWESGMTTTGSIRLDVVQGSLRNPTYVWDYKFGQATLSPSRITQIQNGIPNGANVPILMVKP